MFFGGHVKEEEKVRSSVLKDGFVNGVKIIADFLDWCGVVYLNDMNERIAHFSVGWGLFVRHLCILHIPSYLHNSYGDMCARFLLTIREVQVCPFYSCNTFPQLQRIHQTH